MRRITMKALRELAREGAEVTIGGVPLEAWEREVRAAPGTPATKKPQAPDDRRAVLSGLPEGAAG